MRRRERQAIQRLLAAGGVIVLGLIVLLAVKVVERKVARQEALAALEEQRAETGDAEVEAIDPYAGRSDDAIERVRSAVVGTETVGQRVASGELEARVELFQRAGVEPVGWSARRTDAPTVYAVMYTYHFHAVHFGPEWYVQLDPEGRMPEGSDGVVPANALADHLHRASMEEELRPLNRSDEVLEALTEHRFESGTRLGSALLVSFRGNEPALTLDDMIGWLVVPERAEPDALMYRAYFQWRADGEVQDAWWEVNLLERQFQPRDMQANRIMERGATAASDELIELRPRTLDLSTPPAAEPQPRRRALRHLLSDERLLEAVATLLTYRGRDGALEYMGWEINSTDTRHVYDIACRFQEGEESERVTWRVQADGEAITPTSDLSRFAERVLRMTDTE